MIETTQKGPPAGLGGRLARHTNGTTIETAQQPPLAGFVGRNDRHTNNGEGSDHPRARARLVDSERRHA
jgi:hypothetical protein